MRADLQENLVGDVVVRGAEQIDENLAKGYATVGERRPGFSPAGTVPVEILPFTLPPARAMNAAISSPAYCRLTVGSGSG